MIIADLHIHGRYSRATSKQLSAVNLEKYARIKGVNLLGTGDFQHALWYKEFQGLEEREGIIYTKTGFPFLWQTEISLMYSQGGKGRRVHQIILAPNREVVKQITDFLASKGRLDYDGRPIFGFTSIELVDEMQKISKDIEIIPAHCLTPWFGIFGSKSGFDSLKECFQEKTNKIHAVESGISADPKMLWNFSFLNDKSIISFSDLHSFWPWRIGRESTIFTGELSYKNILKQIRENSFKATVETEPAYGRYHYDGHRKCKFSCSPKKTGELKGICPICKRPLTVGVEYRVEELTNNPKNYKPPKARPFYKLIPLHEIIGALVGFGIATKKVWGIYNQLINEFESEFNILLNISYEELKRVADEKLAKAIIYNRNGKIEIKPGYDGEYGIPVFKEKIESPQRKLI